MKKYITIIVFLALSIFGCKNKTDSSELTEVTFATSKNMWCGLGLIAYEKEYFKEYGLDVDIKFLDAGRYCLDALVSESAEFATIVEVNTAYFGYTGNTSIINIASIVSSTSSGIIANMSNGIEKPEDLAGKILALSPGTTSDIFANRFIEKYKLSRKNIELRQIQPIAMHGAVVSGGVDAASTWDPHIYNINKSLSGNGIVFRDPEIYTGYMLVATRKEWASKNKSTVTSFIKALKKAEQFAISNVNEAKMIVSNIINLDFEIVSATWEDHVMTLKLDEKELLEAIKSEGTWFNQNLEEYKNQEVPDYEPYIVDDYLMEALN